MRNALLATAATLLAVQPALAVDEVFETEEATIHVTTYAEGLSHPWGMAFLPDGDLLVTQRSGTLHVVSGDGAVSEPISGLPEIDARGQGGLLDVAVDPEFTDNRLVYFSFSEPGEGGTNSTAVARGRLNEEATALSEVEVIFSQQPKVTSTKHFGSRLVFDNEGRLYITLGERSDREFRDQAQDLDSHLGKIVRINKDGSVPEDNPFVGQEGALPEIWSYGHRNIQAAALNPETGELWEAEHGPRGGDELNIPEAGANYGWPEVSYGVNYDGTPVGTGEVDAPGFVEPVVQWTPVIAASGMEFYTGNLISDWQGDLFVGGLAARTLVRLELEGETVTFQERLLQELGQRVRAVEQGPDGALYVATDEDAGQILRIAPADAETQ